MKQFILRVLLVLSLVSSFSQVAPAYADKPKPKRSKKAVKKETTVYTTRTGSKYHRSYCSYLRYSSFAENKSDAIAEGYTPCSRCNP